LKPHALAEAVFVAKMLTLLGTATVPIYSVPRRSFGGQKGEPTPVNWRRRLFRVWLMISAAWMMGWIIHLFMYGIQGGFKTTSDFLVVPVLLFGPPIALLLFGVATGWAFRGFKADNGP
jgi:hypothetical protein